MADLEGIIPGWVDGKWEVPEWSFDGRPALIINHMQVGIAGTGEFSGAPHAQEKKAMEELGVIEKQKKLLAAFRERKLSVVVPRYATGAPERDADCAEVVLNKMMRMWELVTTVDDLIAHLPK